LLAKKDELVNKASELLGVELEKVETAIQHMLEEKSVIMEEDDAVYLPPFYYSEVGVARRIREIIETKSMYSFYNFDGIIEDLQRECNIQYDDPLREPMETKCFWAANRGVYKEMKRKAC